MVFMDHSQGVNMQASTFDELWDLIKDIKFAMLTTRYADGQLHSRPMTTQNRSLDANRLLYFFMSKKSDPAQAIDADGLVNLAYAHPGKDRYVSISGSAKLSADDRMKKDLWSKMAQAWFPGGVDDPDLALVEIRIDHAEYWNVEESKLVQLFSIAKAAMTGKPPTDLGEHARVA
jgi:general stress protein 26